MQLRNRTQGIAILTALILMLVVAGVLTLLMTGLFNETRSSNDDIAISSTLTLARGGISAGGMFMRDQAREDLRSIIQSLNLSNTNLDWAFGTVPNGQTNPTHASIITDLDTKVATPLQTAINNRLCPASSNFYPEGSNGPTLKLRIFVRDTSICGGSSTIPSTMKLPSGRYIDGQPNTYALPFIMIAEAKSGINTRTLAIQGEFQFSLARTQLAKYGLFTNFHQNMANSSIWFTNRTLFDGPVHTNQHYRFAGNAWFGENITSAGCSTINMTLANPCVTKTPGAYFGQNTSFKAGSQIPTNPITVNGITARVQGSADWNAGYVKLPTVSTMQKFAAQGFKADGITVADDQGLYLNQNLYSLKLWAGNENRSPLSKSGSNWSPSPAPYQYIQACTTSATACTIYRYNEDSDGNKIFCTYIPASNTYSNCYPSNKPFNGMIYVNGKIDRLTGPARTTSSSTNPNDAPPALAPFAQITIASLNQTRITGDLKYQDAPCTGYPTESNNLVTPANCNNLTAKNILGIYADDEKVLIGNQNSDSTLNAPQNIAINAVVMSGAKEVAVENHDQGGDKGYVNLLGGIIENYYGAFGTFSGDTPTNGYGRRFTYDRRLRNGMAPPFFPTSDTPELARDVFVFSFGQSEQVQ